MRSVRAKTETANQAKAPPARVSALNRAFEPVTLGEFVSRRAKARRLSFAGEASATTGGSAGSLWYSSRTAASRDSSEVSVRARIADAAAPYTARVQAAGAILRFGRGGDRARGPGGADRRPRGSCGAHAVPGACRWRAVRRAWRDRDAGRGHRAGARGPRRVSLRTRVVRLERRRSAGAADPSACAACGGLGRLAFVLEDGGNAAAPWACERCGRTLLHLVSVDGLAPSGADPGPGA